MACVLRVHRSGIDCDHCKKDATDLNPVMEVIQATGRGRGADRNVVYVCVRCWDKAIAKDRKTVTVPE